MSKIASSGVSIQPGSLVDRLRGRLRAVNNEGQSILEFALTLPILLTLVTGIAIFGIALNNYIEMSAAVGSSAQYLAMSRGNTTDPCSTAAGAFVSAAPNLNSSKLQFSYVLNGTSYGAYTGSSASTCTAGATNIQNPGVSAQMTVSYPCSLAIFGHNYWPSCNLAVQATEIIQ
jgi:Flp pilus assembly protein TadG